jgi:hypothetical protein
MTGVRTVGAPAIRRISDFHEINVRTYVDRDGRDPGVWFFSLDAGNATACSIARRFFGLPYHFAEMSLCEEPDRVEYRHRRRGTEVRSEIACRLGESLKAPEPGSLEYFLVERYLLFSLQSGRLRSGRVHNRPYPVQSAVIEKVDENLVQAAGITPGGIEHVIFSPGVDVRVFRLADLSR